MSDWIIDDGKLKNSDDLQEEHLDDLLDKAYQDFLNDYEKDSSIDDYDLDDFLTDFDIDIKDYAPREGGETWKR